MMSSSMALTQPKRTAFHESGAEPLEKRHVMSNNPLDVNQWGRDAFPFIQGLIPEPRMSNSVNIGPLIT